MKSADEEHGCLQRCFGNRYNGGSGGSGAGRRTDGGGVGEANDVMEFCRKWNWN